MSRDLTKKLEQTRDSPILGKMTEEECGFWELSTVKRLAKFEVMALMRVNE